MARRVARELDKILDGRGPRQAAMSRAAAELRPPHGRFTISSPDIAPIGR